MRKSWPCGQSAFVLFALLAAVAAGCGGSGEQTVAPVSGVVTLDSKPLPGVTVLFQPAAGPQTVTAGPGSIGVTGPDGRYVLETIEARKKGAIVGKHNVTLSTAQGDPNDDRAAAGSKEVIPANQRTRTFVVPAEGTEKADFALSSK